MLKEGDRAIAGQPIAVFTQGETNRLMGFSVYYLKLTSDDKDEYPYFKPKFLLQDGLSELDFEKRYISVSSKEVVEKELTNREKKK